MSLHDLYLGRGTLDFEMSRYLSEKGGITQQLYIRGDKSIHSESSLNFLSENVNFTVNRSRVSDFIGTHVHVFTEMYLFLYCFKCGPWGSKWRRSRPCIQQTITLKMGHQRWSDIYVVFTKILCGLNFCVW